MKQANRLFVAALLLGMIHAHSVQAQATSAHQPAMQQRYGIPVDPERYPQGDPQETIRSVIAATEAGDIEYLLSHLLSPPQVDAKLGGDVEAMHKLASKATPEKSKRLVSALRTQLDEGIWTIHRSQAWAHCADLPDLSLQRIGNRWFMHNTPEQRPQ
jgi:hypothetical protein